jgi:DtxR family transcriptional regulator, Mn-dependent transcriptional regulator
MVRIVRGGQGNVIGVSATARDADAVLRGDPLLSTGFLRVAGPCVWTCDGSMINDDAHRRVKAPRYPTPAASRYLQSTMSDDPFLLSQKFPAAPNYLIQMYLFEREGQPVVGSRISERLGVSGAAVTQSMGRLVARGLVRHDAVQGFSLTEEGRAMAERVVSRHYLVERLLVDELDVPWDVADEEAVHLQGSLTSRLESILTERLGRPQTCPHGNPFPGSPDESRILAAPPLTALETGRSGRLLRVTEAGELVRGLLAFCSENGLHLGVELAVLGRDQDSVGISLSGVSLAVPTEYARHICIEIDT